MDPRPAPALSDSFSAALDWWREAGVDSDFTDEPVTWLAGPEAEPPAVSQPAKEAAASLPATPQIGGNPEDWPQDLTSFHTWWLEEPGLAPGGPTRRVPPIGSSGADLMVIVPMPEEQDSDILLGGSEGQLVRGFAQAAGIAAERLYLASALPAHLAMPDWEALGAAGLGKILDHHCALVAPRRLVVLGAGILPLLGHDPAQAMAETREIDSGTPIPMLASYSPERLCQNARLRAMLWRRWLDWTDE